MKKVLIQALIVLLVFGQFLPAMATEAEVAPTNENAITLIPTDDTFIEGQEGRTTNINGADPNLYIAHDGHSNPRKIYLKFDLEDIDLSNISDATLRLYNTDTRYSRTITGYKTSGNDTSWTEDSLTWENAPEPGDPILTRDGVPASFTTQQIADGSASGDDRLEGAQYYDMDISTYLEDGLNDGQLSIILQSNGYSLFASKEYEDGEFAPQLVLSQVSRTTLTPIDDTFIEGREDRVTTINGSSGNLQIADNSNANPRRIYLKFDVEEIDLTEINSATLRLYNIDTRYSRTVTAYETTDNDTSWTEDSLNWENAPEPGEVILSQNGAPSSFTTLQIADGSAVGDDRIEGAQYYEMDITSYVEEGINDGQLSLVLQSTGYTVFASKEYQNGEFAPELVLSTEEQEEPVNLYKDLEEDGRSSLYPEDWYPGFGDDEGRFLHDFSYAGYKMGEESIPTNIPGISVDVTEAPYHVDNTGEEDVTAAIQSAIDDVGEAGGGVVYLPEGTYKVKPQGINNEALKINHSGVVLRGAGPDQTFIFNDEPYMRAKNIISITSEGNRFVPIPDTVSVVSNDLLKPTTNIPVQDASGFQVGDWVQINNEYTAEFIEEHDMQGWWDIYEGNPGVTFYRKIVAVDLENHVITIDIPTRYPLKIRDNTSVYKMNAPISDVGIEDLSIGNVENLTPGIAESDNTVEGTAGYQVAGTNVIQFSRVVDSWARNVHSYRPSQNSDEYDYHILSNGIRITNSRNVTVTDADMRKPLFRGAGGNGYLFEIVGNDNLVTNSNAEEGRHNYTFSHMRTSGNVIHNSVSKDPTHVIDFHQYLSMSNLLDGMILDGDTIEANVRPYPSSSTTYKHGQTTSQTVIWNTTGLNPHFKHSDGTIIDSRQFGHGYVIGTQGEYTSVRITPVEHAGRDTAPVDFAEGIGQGDQLQPQSLYVDQLQKRLARQDVDLKSIKINGKPLTTYQFGTLEYDIVLPYGTEASDVPTVEATTFESGSTVSVANPDSLPGTTIITVTSQDGSTTAEYTLNFTIADTPPVLSQVTVSPDRSQQGWKSGVKIDNGNEAWLNVIGIMSDGTNVEMKEATLHFSSSNEEVLSVDQNGKITTNSVGQATISVSVTVGEVEITSTLVVISDTPVTSEFETVPIVAITSSGDDGNVAENVLDGDYDTRWSASGDGQWIMADIGEAMSIESISLAFFNGDARRSIFEIEVSTDGENWINVYEKNEAGNSSGDTTLLENFQFTEPEVARFIKVVGYGNTVNAWNSITEMLIHPTPMENVATIDSVRTLLNGYVSSEELRSPLLNQLTNSLNLAERHLHGGRENQAVKQLEKFLKQLNNEPMERYISIPAKEALTLEVNVLLATMIE